MQQVLCGQDPLLPLVWLLAHLKLGSKEVCSLSLGGSVPGWAAHVLCIC